MWDVFKRRVRNQPFQRQKRKRFSRLRALLINSHFSPTSVSRMFNFHVYFCCAEALLPRSTLSSLSLFPLLLPTLHFLFSPVLPIFSFHTLFPLFYFILFHFVFYLDILISFCHSLRFFFSFFVRIILGLRTRYTCVEKIWIIYTQIRRRAESNTTFPPFSFPLFLSYYLLLLSHPFPFYSLPFHDPILCLSPATQLIYPLTFSFYSPSSSLSLAHTYILLFSFYSFHYLLFYFFLAHPSDP